MRIFALFAFIGIFGFAGCDEPDASKEIEAEIETDAITAAPPDGTMVNKDADSATVKQITTNLAPYTADSGFVSLAASGGMLEVAAGKAALEKGTSEDVKQVGRQMAAGHTKINAELKALASRKGWALPTAMNAGHQASFNRISALSGPAFDKAYMQQMVTGHETAISQFRSAALNAADPDLKAWADEKILTLRMHLDMARKKMAVSTAK